jgi:hypothetical protein
MGGAFAMNEEHWWNDNGFLRWLAMAVLAFGIILGWIVWFFTDPTWACTMNTTDSMDIGTTWGNPTWTEQAQIVSPACDGDVATVDVGLWRTGTTPSDHMYLDLRAYAAGTPGTIIATSEARNVADVPYESCTLTTFTFGSALPLTSGTEYFWTLHRENPNTGNYLAGCGNTGLTGAQGNLYGSTWTALSLQLRTETEVMEAGAPAPATIVPTGFTFWGTMNTSTGAFTATGTNADLEHIYTVGQLVVLALSILLLAVFGWMSFSITKRVERASNARTRFR